MNTEDQIVDLQFLENFVKEIFEFCNEFDISREKPLKLLPLILQKYSDYSGQTKTENSLTNIDLIKNYPKFTSLNISKMVWPENIKNLKQLGTNFSSAKNTLNEIFQAAWYTQQYNKLNIGLQKDKSEPNVFFIINPIDEKTAHKAFKKLISPEKYEQFQESLKKLPNDTEFDKNTPSKPTKKNEESKSTNILNKLNISGSLYNIKVISVIFFLIFCTGLIFFNQKKHIDLDSVLLKQSNVLLKQGDILFKKGEFGKAYELFKQATDINPNFSEGWEKLGTTILKFNRDDHAYIDKMTLKTAITYFDNAIKIDKNNFEAFSGKGTVLALMGKYEEALHNFNEAIKIKIDRWEDWANKAQAFRLLKKPKEAFEAYSKASELNPENSNLYMFMGNILIDLGREQEADNFFKKSITLEVNNAEAWHTYGMYYKKIGNFEKAIENIIKATKLDSKNSTFFYNLGNIYLNLNKYTEATEAYNQALALNPISNDPMINKGIAAFGQGDKKLALKSFKSHNMLDPNNPASLMNVGSILIQMGDPEKALEFLYKARDLTSNLTVYVWIGQALGDLGRNEEAEKSFNIAIKNNKEDIFAYQSKGTFFLKQRKFKEAVEIYNQALKINPKDYYSWSNKIDALILSNNNEEALRALREVIKLKEGKFSSWDLAGSILEKNNLLEEALEAYNKAILNAEDKTDMKVRKGYVLKKMGRMKEAYSIFENTFKQHPNPNIYKLWKKDKIILNYNDGTEITVSAKDFKNTKIN